MDVGGVSSITGVCLYDVKPNPWLCRAWRMWWLTARWCEPGGSGKAGRFLRRAYRSR